MTITKSNTANQENPINKKVLLTYKKGLLSFKQDLLTFTKKDLVTNTKKATENFHCKFLRQNLVANSHGKFSRQILKYV